MRILSIFLLLFFVTACEVPGNYDEYNNGAGSSANDDGAYMDDDGAGAYDDNSGYGDSDSAAQADLIKTAGGDRVLFDYDSSKLDANDRQVIEGVAKWLNKNPSASVLVEGHCDERGTREYNLALGERRATAVKQYLKSLGISASRVDTTSYGKERPAVQGSNENAWRQNRRGEVKARR